MMMVKISLRQYFDVIEYQLRDLWDIDPFELTRLASMPEEQKRAEYNRRNSIIAETERDVRKEVVKLQRKVETGELTLDAPYIDAGSSLKALGPKVFGEVISADIKRREAEKAANPLASAREANLNSLRDEAGNPKPNSPAADWLRGRDPYDTAPKPGGQRKQVK